MYGSSINFRTRYYEIKSRTFAKLGSHPNFSTDLLYNHPANGKPQACALHKAVQFDKAFKNMSHLFFFYSYSRIFHIYTDILPFSFKSETYLSRMGKLGSVGDKIRNDLHNTIRIAL